MREGTSAGGGAPARRGWLRRNRPAILVLLLALLVGLALGAAGAIIATAHATSAAAPGAPPGSAPAGGPASPTASGVPRAARALQVVGLGDSVPSADTCGCAGYLEQVRVWLAALTDRPVTLHNDAVSGWRTRDVLGDLRGGAAGRDLGSGADLVVIEVGANDFDLSRLSDPSCRPAGSSACFSATLTALRSTLAAVVRQVRLLDPTSPRVALLGYWNVGLDGAVGRRRGPTYVAASDELTRAVNTVVAGVARATGSTYVDAYTPFKGPDGLLDPTNDLLEDGDHPNSAGHTILADAVIDALEHSGAIASWRTG